MRTGIRHTGLLSIGLALAALCACSSNADTMTDRSHVSGNETNGQKTQTLCTKYGGPEAIDSVVRVQVLGSIAGDCRINAFFSELQSDAFLRVEDCLSLQVQELMGCEGVVYQGSEASNGLPCRSMVDAHAGLGISEGDFLALIEDVVAGLSEAGVSAEDIDVAAPALLGMQEDIVDDGGDSGDSGVTTRDACEARSGAMEE